MRTGISNPLIRAALLAATLPLAVGLMLLLLTLQASADPAGTVGEGGIDMDATFNTATSLGTRQECVSKTVTETFDIDVTVRGIDAADQMSGFQYTLNYDPTKLKVIAANHLLLINAGGGTIPIPLGDSTPDTDGAFLVGIADFGANTESGDGVLSRITLESIGTGVSDLTLSGIVISNAAFAEIPNITSVLDAQEAQGEPCPSAETPMPPMSWLPR